jgi:hypothetical protein
MSVGMVKRILLGAVALVLVVGCVGVSPVFAAQPWWKMEVDTAPAVLQPGQATDEVQEAKVTATEGTFLLQSGEATGLGSFTFAWDATHQEVQEGLEEMFGKGNVEVPSGQGDATGSDPYRIVWKGALADRAIEPLRTGGPVAVSEVTKGRSDATLVLTAANMGDADLTGPVTISAKLPLGLTSLPWIVGHGRFGQGRASSLPCSVVSLSCTYSGATAPYKEVQMFIPVNLNAGAKSGEMVEVSVSGGNAPPAKRARAMIVGNTSASFGIENYELTPEEEGGATATQAGSHPFQLTTTIMTNQRAFNFNQLLGEYDPEPAEIAKDLVFKLPPGLVGNPTSFPQCTIAQFTLPEISPAGCPNSTAVGVASVTVRVYLGGHPILFTVLSPVFNLTPAVGEPARFGFIAAAPIFLDTSVRTGGDYGVTVKVSNINQAVTFVGGRVTFWGVPGDPRHDSQRGWSCVGDSERAGEFGVPCSATSERLPPPLLELPTSCTGSLQTTVEGDSWGREDSFVSSGPSLSLPALDGCNELPFGPSISVAPDGLAGSSPSGLTVGIHVPQDVSLDGEGLGEADVRDTTVALPAGVGLNPSAADGLQACSEEQIALSVDAEALCPEASKVATLEIKSPLLPNALTGEAYLAEQNANPFGSLVALYFVARDPVSGTLVKVAGEVKPDPVTGQLVATFKDTPQLPFEDLRLHFFGGDRAPLSTPALCGSYTTTSSIAPWSGNEPATPSSTFDISSGPNGSPCSNPLPFSPSLTAGTTSIQAGGFSPFTMTMSRPDGSQNLTAVKLRMPPGLLGTLATVKLCKEPEADLGTCGPESLIGHTTVSVGVGGDPFSVKGGEVFITEGYGGAPYGLSIVNPAKAGPFDLGKVIVRARIEVDPITAALTVATDTSGQYKIPTILDGIPLQIQHVNVTIDRSGFTFNPTNCSPLQIGGSLTSDQGAVQSLSVPFQITNCAVLAFRPKLTAKTNGRTSRANGASLSVKLTYPAGPFDANISKVKVDLPKQLPSRLTTLQRACPAATFNANPAACPSASIVGHAKATTPVLPVGLEGPAYFVSHGGEEFPQLIIVLQGYGTTVHLVGDTFISKAGITSSTFKQVPDVPVGTFELTLPQGKFSALAANGNLCTTRKLAMPTLFVAQNGAVIHTSTPIVPTGCAKKKAHRASRRHKGTKHGKK